MYTNDQDSVFAAAGNDLGACAQELAKSTHRISVFTEGILAMDATMLGIIQARPPQPTSSRVLVLK